ncbi:hypothetical protein DICVIV_10825 [Dictyocaulus viviparus]|uniref:Uncharacterized protein n=1 Tax=Dictyocaulus viviparus TaxID=29172 RepID=A0A0D8XHF0_DICVI|nr:hypothetical protein DICVIV_10825 [Dictyocaulus viviparus]
MVDDKVNMALDDIIKLNKRKRAGKVNRRNTESIRQAKERKKISSRGRGGLSRRRGGLVNLGQRRSARTRIIRRRSVSSPSTNVSVNDAATRRLVKNLVNKALRRIRAASSTSVLNRGAVYTNDPLRGISARSRGIRKRVVEIPSVVVRRPRRVRTAGRTQIEEEPDRFMYQTVRVVKREPASVQVVRQRQERLPYHDVNHRDAVRIVQNQRASVMPTSHFIQQRLPQFSQQRSRVVAHQPARIGKALITRRSYPSIIRRGNPRGSVIYVNEQMSSRVQPARSGIRFIRRNPNRQFVAYHDEFDRYPSSSTANGNRGRKRKGRGFDVAYEY